MSNRSNGAVSIFCLFIGLTIFLPAPSYAACTNPARAEGAIIYNQDQNVPQVCAGSTWVALGNLNPSAGGGSCSNPSRTEGAIVYNIDNKVLQYCDGTNWIAVQAASSGGGSGGCAFDPLIVSSNMYQEVRGIYGNDTYVFIVEFDTNLFALDKATLQDVGTYYGTLTSVPGPGYQSIFADNTNIFVADGAAGARAFTFNGSAFTLQGTYNTLGSARGIWGDGTYIYVADNTNGVIAFTFSGSTWTPAAGGNITNSTFNTAGNANATWSDGTYVYVADGTNGVVALTFNGTAWAAATGNIATSTYNTSGTATSVWGDGTYIYVADGSSGLHALSFNGSAWTLLDTYPAEGFGEYWQVHVAGGVIYVTQFEAADPTYSYTAKALTFDGATLAQLSPLPAFAGNSMWSDSAKLYVAAAMRSYGALAYGLCAN